MSPLFTKVPGPIRQFFWSTYGKRVWDAEHDRTNPVVGQVLNLVRRNKSGPKMRILDAGCGTGIYARGLAECGYQVTAVDSAPGMLVHARKRATTLPPACSGALTVEAMRVDRPLPFPEAAFDAALLISVLQAVDNPAETLCELHRVLVPGGLLCVLHFLPHPNTALSLREEVTLRSGMLQFNGSAMRMWQVALMALKSSVERHQLTHQWTPDELVALVTTAGFTARLEPRERTQHWVMVTARAC